MHAAPPLKYFFSLLALLLFIAGPLRPQRKTAAGQTAPMQNAPDCLSYEPSIVRLTGTIVRETFLGAPNYASVEHGDKPEVYWLLNLSRPICVRADETEPLNSEQKDVLRIQLVFPDASVYKTKKELVGKNVVAEGTLFGSHTGHHHTRVLLTVRNLRKAE